MIMSSSIFFNATTTTEIYTLSLHDALPISGGSRGPAPDRGTRLRPRLPDGAADERRALRRGGPGPLLDRKSTRLNSSHANISYAVFCLKKKMIMGWPNVNGTTSQC